MPRAAQRPHLLYVAVEDWFFASHFLPMARAAMKAGYDVTLATRVRDHRSTIEATGVRVIALEGERGSLNPSQLWREIAALKAVFGSEKPDLLHLIGLRPIVSGTLAARSAGLRRRIVALTGLGLSGAGEGARAKVIRLLLRYGLRPLVDGPDVQYLFENRSDPQTLGLNPAQMARTTFIGGAGIDPAAYPMAPLPSLPPLRLAFVSRMLWSKGADLAVEAVCTARARGVDVTLDLYGAPDPANPRALSEETLRGWAARPGILWHGATRDVPAVWAAHHAAIQPSRGGEGLPRALLEAAACGRAIITTDVPGCRDLVRDGSEGFIVPRDNIEALTGAIMSLASDPARLSAMGQAAHTRVRDGFTEDAVTAAVLKLYARMMP